MTKYQILLVAVVINTLVALGYMIVMGRKKQLEKGILIGGIMLIVPVGGPFLIFLFAFSASEAYQSGLYRSG